MQLEKAVPDVDATREFLPTNLPTGNGSYSPFQRLGSPRRERKSLIIRVCLDCHGRGREFESGRPRHCYQSVGTVAVASNGEERGLLLFAHSCGDCRTHFVGRRLAANIRSTNFRFSQNVGDRILDGIRGFGSAQMPQHHRAGSGS
jgi:hypothetical protein